MMTKKTEVALISAAKKTINIFINGKVEVNKNGIEFTSSLCETMGNIADSSSLQTLRMDCENILGKKTGPMWIGIKNNKLIFWAVWV